MTGEQGRESVSIIVLKAIDQASRPVAITLNSNHPDRRLKDSCLSARQGYAKSGPCFP